MTPKAQTMTITKIDKLDFIKIINFCASKNIIKKVKRQPTEQDKIFADLISDKGFISRIYKEHLQLSNKNMNNPI